MVEKDQVKPLIGRYSPKSVYDKRFIAGVLEQIRGGVSRREVCYKYNLSLGTLKNWLESERLGIKSSLKKPVPIQFKRSVVRAVKSGRLTIVEAQQTYGIGSSTTIKIWIEQFKHENADLGFVNDSEMKKKPAQDNTADSNQDIKALQKALEDAQLKVAALNTLIDVAEEQLKINIRKKPGAKQSND